MSDKARRQTTLRELVESHALQSQNEIVRRMRAQGFEVTQASVSRDARELGLIKIGGKYLPVQNLGIGLARPGGDPIAGLITAVEPVGANLIIVRTTIGSASSVAVAIDADRLTDIVGTIAGDDTLFIAVRSRSAQGRVVAALKSRMTPKNANGRQPTATRNPE